MLKALPRRRAYSADYACSVYDGAPFLIRYAHPWGVNRVRFEVRLDAFRSDCLTVFRLAEGGSRLGFGLRNGEGETVFGGLVGDFPPYFRRYSGRKLVWPGPPFGEGNRVYGRFRLYFIDRCGVGIRPGIGPSGLKLEGAAAPERGQPEESFRPKADQGQASTFGRKCIRWGVSTNSLRSFMGPIHVLVQFRFNFLPV